MHECPRCGAQNAIVNQCKCDPNNLPTPAPNRSPAQWDNAEHFSDGKHDGHLIVDAWGYNVANIWHQKFCQTPQRDAEVDANARLIAAAPDLLAACQAYIHALRVDNSPGKQTAAVRMIDAAIAKATTPH